jgi:hypothetical protein
MTDIFSDLNSLRLSPELQGGSAREVLSHVPVRKPTRHEFFRVHPDPNMSLSTAVFIDKEERETFFVAPSMWEVLLGEMKPVSLVTAVTRQGVEIIWPLALPGDGARRNDWYETAWQAADLAKKTWVRMPADMSLGAYRIYEAQGELSEPSWPDKPLDELLRIAFRGRVIDSEDHPVVRRLRGLT